MAKITSRNTIYIKLLKEDSINILNSNQRYSSYLKIYIDRNFNQINSHIQTNVNRMSKEKNIVTYDILKQNITSKYESG